jgi:beta-lactam-binding protein with PASTA domain
MTATTHGNLRGYIRSKDFKYTLIAIILFLAIIMLLAFLWLKIYTHHGQELELPDYTGYQYEDAERDARKKKFRMSVLDSIHILGKPGGEILKQNPAPRTLVKQKRMIYVTITKRSPDKILSGRLPEMYGKNYDRKKKELAEHFEIKSKVIGTRFDPGDAGQILEVRYKGKVIMDSRVRQNDVLIEKGDVLDFVISEKSGGIVAVPNLICKTYEEAQFLLENLGLVVGEIIERGSIESMSTAYITDQEPPENEEIMMETPIKITVTQNKPGKCE